MGGTDHSEQIALLKQSIRLQLNAAARYEHIDGTDALRVLVELTAEMVARVADDWERHQLISEVVECFPGIVQIEREVPEGTTWQ
jgi:hypothetical protein